jgi:hypothetical protein
MHLALKMAGTGIVVLLKLLIKMTSMIWLFQENNGFPATTKTYMVDQPLARSRVF